MEAERVGHDRRRDRHVRHRLADALVRVASRRRSGIRRTRTRAARGWWSASSGASGKRVHTRELGRADGGGVGDVDAADGADVPEAGAVVGRLAVVGRTRRAVRRPGGGSGRARRPRAARSTGCRRARPGGSSPTSWRTPDRSPSRRRRSRGAGRTRRPGRRPCGSTSRPWSGSTSAPATIDCASSWPPNTTEPPVSETLSARYARSADLLEAQHAQQVVQHGH